MGKKLYCNSAGFFFLTQTHSKKLPGNNYWSQYLVKYLSFPVKGNDPIA